MTTLTAVLFVGGESRRMGADKATQLWNGESLWSRQLRTLREVKPERIFISARSKPAWCPADVEIILDEPPSRGPLSGLAATLQQIETIHLLALAVDLPMMNSEFLRSLWQQACPDLGVVPQLNGFYEPLGAIYPVGAAAQAVAAIRAERFALQDFIRSLLVENLMRTIEIKEPDLFLNVNSPDLLKKKPLK